jgi:hypothetical protein
MDTQNRASKLSLELREPDHDKALQKLGLITLSG